MNGSTYSGEHLGQAGRGSCSTSLELGGCLYQGDRMGSIFRNCHGESSRESMPWDLVGEAGRGALGKARRGALLWSLGAEGRGLLYPHIAPAPLTKT